MKKTVLKLLILFGATGLLPWVAYFIGQVGSRMALYAHVAGVSAVLLMKIWDVFKSRKDSGSREKTLDDSPPKEVNDSGSEPPAAA